jgi:hypothetical protein
MVALRGDVTQTIRHLHSVDLTDDDLIAFAVARSEKRKAIDAEIVTPQLADTQETHLRAKKRPRKKE